MVGIFHHSIHPLRSKGDSIVEVLIALGVVSLVLVSAYALTSRNVGAGQQTQEQSAALKLVERQTEQLLAADSVPTTPGCFNPDGIYVVLPTTTCTVTEDGTEYDSTVDRTASYSLSITQNSSTKTYVVNAQWITTSGKTANASMHVRRAD